VHDLQHFFASQTQSNGRSRSTGDAFFKKSDAFARQDFRRLSGNKKVVIDGGMAVRVKNCQGWRLPREMRQRFMTRRV